MGGGVEHVWDRLRFDTNDGGELLVIYDGDGDGDEEAIVNIHKHFSCLKL